MALILVSSTLGSSDVPFIVTHKKASLIRLKSGDKRVSVSIDLCNQGPTTAYDVSLTDDSWSQDVFNVVSGNTSTSWERLDAGGLLHAFELESKMEGMFYGAPAVIMFHIPTTAALQEHIQLQYCLQISVISIVYLVASPSKSGAGKGSKKKR
ncbi:hypothetical protein CK203_046037 [Vitis vinifera]|uniref:Translocon-associated protein subunit beta n=1 Tax=Vitis vinifera TaxID=29760 RepID=A0A438HGS1_VITVI|nr:hypothetical protein CK203_046037 [Vitis vinifera]